MDNRISDYFMNQNFINNMGYTKSRLNEISRDISSGKQLRQPHDDPKNIGLALKYRTMQSETDQYINNANYSFQWLTTVEQELRGVSDELTHAKEVATRAANGTSGTLERRQLAADIEETIKTVVSHANARYDDKYIFSKTQTQTQSIQASDADGDGYLDTFTTVEDLGLPTDNMAKEVGKGIYEDMGYSAKDVFVSNNVMKSLTDLRDALLADNQTNINASLDEINAASASLRGTQSAVGEKASRLQDRIGVLQNMKTQLQGMSSDLEDTDMAKAISQLNNWQTIYQASLQATAQISKLSLVNFI